MHPNLASHLIHAPITTAQRLFAAFAVRGVAVSVYKNVARAGDGAAGRGDLDLFVPPGDLAVFEEVVAAHGGVRAFPSRFYDNAIPSRRDWFVPLEGGGILHLDVASPVMVGRKFCKTYRLDVAYSGGSPLSAVAPQEEARLALARFAFNPPSRRPGAWLRCPADIAAALAPLLPAEVAEWEWREGGQAARCTLRKQGEALLIDRQSLAAIRRAVRAANGASMLAPLRDAMVHTARRVAHATVRRAARVAGSETLGKRRLARGTIIALIGPDGVGKSTQSRALARDFGQKLAASAVYMGSNDGSWMRIRKHLRLRRRKPSPSGSATKGTNAKRGWLHLHGSALWRLVIALQRARAMRRALRLAAGGAIAIADRWPQTLEPGILDGPSVRPPRDYPLAHHLWRIERRIYAAIERHRPGLTIHLDCDYATSHARKPGDIAPDAFAARIALMERMRDCDDAVVVVDARLDRQQVFADLRAAAWQHIAAIQRAVP